MEWSGSFCFSHLVRRSCLSWEVAVRVFLVVAVVYLSIAGWTVYSHYQFRSRWDTFELQSCSWIPWCNQLLLLISLSLSPALNLPNVVWCFVKEFSREEEAFIRQMKGSSPLVPIIIQEQFHSEHFFSLPFVVFVLFVDAPDLICVFIQVYKTVLMFSVLKNNL